MKGGFGRWLVAVLAMVSPCIVSAGVETVQVNASTLGVNFCYEAQNMAADSEEAYGFHDEAGGRGGLLAEKLWVNANTKPGDITLEDTANARSYRLSYGGGGGIWGPNSTASAPAGKLLASYLDNDSTLTFSGLPPSGYDVAIIFSGDGGKYSAVTVNGVSKTYNEAGELVEGTTAWGVREQPSVETKTLSATGTASAGQVMFLSGLTTSTLTLQTTNDAASSPQVRGTVAAIQIYIKAGTYECINATAAGPTTVKLSELLEEAPSMSDLMVVLADGATLQVDSALSLSTLQVIAEGSVTVAGTETTLGGIQLVDMRQVTGSATVAYENVSEDPEVMPQLSGVDVLRKQGAKPYVPTSNAALNGRQFIAEAGETTLNFNLQSTVATAEAPMTVTGQGSLLRIEANQNYDRAPSNAVLRAEKGATLALKGVNLFSTSAPPSVQVDAATLRAECIAGSHIKVGRVTLANDANVEIAGEGSAYSEEGLILLTAGEATAKLSVVSGTSAIRYAEGARENMVTFSEGGSFEVAEDAKLSVDVKLGRDIIKEGAGELTLPASRMRSAEVRAGTLVVENLSGTFAPSLSGEGTVRLCTTGDTAFTGALAPTVSLVFEGAHTFALGLSRPLIASLPEGAKLRLTVSADELLEGKVLLPLGEGVDPAKLGLELMDADGQSLGFGTPSVGADGTLEIAITNRMPTIAATASWGTADAWSTGSVPLEGTVGLKGGETEEQAITVTLDVAIPEGISHILIFGHVRLVTSGAQAVIPAEVELQEGAALTVSSDFEAAFTVPEGTTLALTGASVSQAVTVNGTLQLDGATMSQAVTVNGTLTSAGDSAVQNEGNVFAGVVDVLSGTLSLNAAEQKLCGTLNVRAGATFKNLRSADALYYTGAATVNVWGTVDMGATRWTIGSRNVLNLYAGAQVLGSGQGDNYGTSAWDWFEASTVHFPEDGGREGTVSFPATLRLRGVTVTFDVANPNLSVELSGKIIGGSDNLGALTKAGSGNSRLILSGEGKAYAGATAVDKGYLDIVGEMSLATSSITAASGTALTFQADEAGTAATYSVPITLTGSGRLDKFGTHEVTLSGVISGEGPLNVEAGTLKLLAANTRSASARTTVDAGATLDVSDASARLYGMTFGGLQGQTTFTVRGRLRTRNWSYSEGEGAGCALGALRANEYTVELDGGIVTFVDAAGDGQLGTRGFRVTAAGATLEIPEGLTLSLPASETAYVSLNAAGTMNVQGGGLCLLQTQPLAGSLRIAEGARLSGSGTVQGSVTFAEGAELATTEGLLTVGGLSLPTTKASVKVIVPEATEGADVLKCSPALAEGFDGTAFIVDGSPLRVVPNADGSALVLAFVVTLPETIGADGGSLTETAAAKLAEAAKVLGVAEVSEVTGRTANRALTANEISGALECFTGSGLVFKGEPGAEGTPLSVAYDFGIARMMARALSIEGGASEPYVMLAVQVKGAEDGAAVDYAENTKVEILLGGVPVSAEPLEVAPDGKAIPSGVRWFRFPYAPQGTTSPGISVRAVSTP